ncbi:MAG: hypothetical protein JST93_08070 [Acidobacteria bacterium]|nr:hypothetical protein [Acidobacteriota bacterium]
MAALPQPTYGLANLYLFPVYQTREEYRQKTGQEAPPFDPTKPVKSWCDPSALASSRRKLIYDNVVALADSGRPLAGPDGQPMLEPLMIDRDFAAVVNIPVKDFTGQFPETPTIGVEIPVPMRALEAGEELFFGFGGVVMVRNREAFEKVEVGFLHEDRLLLRAIASKLGVTF